MLAQCKCGVLLMCPKQSSSNSSHSQLQAYPIHSSQRPVVAANGLVYLYRVRQHQPTTLSCHSKKLDAAGHLCGPKFGGLNIRILSSLFPSHFQLIQLHCFSSLSTSNIPSLNNYQCQCIYYSFSSLMQTCDTTNLATNQYSATLVTFVHILIFNFAFVSSVYSFNKFNPVQLVNFQLHLATFIPTFLPLRSTLSNHHRFKNNSNGRPRPTQVHSFLATRSDVKSVKDNCYQSRANCFRVSRPATACSGLT